MVAQLTINLKMKLPCIHKKKFNSIVSVTTSRLQLLQYNPLFCQLGKINPHNLRSYTKWLGTLNPNKHSNLVAQIMQFSAANISAKNISTIFCCFITFLIDHFQGMEQIYSRVYFLKQSFSSSMIAYDRLIFMDFRTLFIFRNAQ